MAGPDQAAPEPGDAPDELAQRLDEARRHVQELLPGVVAAGNVATPAGPQPVFLLHTAQGLRDVFLELQRRLAPLGLLPLLRARGDRPTLVLIPKPAPGRWAWQTNVLLFLATAATTYYAGYLQSASLVRAGLLTDAVGGGIAFSVAVLAILVAHEMAHKLVALSHGIDASLPYFLPMIPPIGTMGAVIMTRTPAPNRDSLMDLGASGPIAGFLVAIPVLIYGVTRSFIISPDRLQDVISIPDPLLIRGLIRLVLNPSPDAVVLGHPVLFAGWIGLIVTSINLLPAGMLDGGHAIRAVFGARVHTVLSYAGAVLAAVMGFYPMAILIVLLMRRGHVGPLDDVSPVSPSRYLIGIVLVVVFVLSAVVLPLPFFQ